MKRTMYSDWLPERARWAYLGIARFVPAKVNFVGVIFWPYNKTFIDKFVGQDGWILASFSL